MHKAHPVGPTLLAPLARGRVRGARGRPGWRVRGSGGRRLRPSAIRRKGLFFGAY